MVQCTLNENKLKYLPQIPKYCSEVEFIVVRVFIDYEIYSTSEMKALLKVCLSWTASLLRGQAIPAPGWKMAEHMSAWPLRALTVILAPISV